MHKLLHILLGVDPAPWAEGGGWRLEWLSAPHGDGALLLLVVAALAAWATLWLYRKEGRALPLRIRLVLSALRLLAAAGVLAMLLDPVMVFIKEELSPSHLLVLMDMSESMDLRDAFPDSARANKAARALRLSGAAELGEHSRLDLANKALSGGLTNSLGAGGDRIVTVLPFTGRLVSQTPTQPASTQPDTEIDRTATGIGAALREAIAAYRGQPLAGVLLITDGQSNTGEPPLKAAEFAATEGVPVVALAAGTPEGPRNAKVTKIDVSPVVFIGDNNQLHVLVESRGMAGVPATMVLERRREDGEWEEAGRQPISVGDGSRIQTVTFDFSEPQPTRLEFRATLIDAGPELTTDDNVAVAEVRAIRQKVRVLFIAGNPFPEVQFIRNALLRDKGVDLSTWLQSADTEYQHPGHSPIRRLPISQEELNTYDCVVLYDPDPGAWPANFGQLLQDFVGQAGGGLVYIAGERMTGRLFDNQQDPQLAWLGMLPVVREPGLFQTEVSMRLSSREPWQLDITPDGAADTIFHFAATAEENQRIYHSLPGMYWHFSVTRAKPGATVLARHGDPRMRNEYGQEVFFATQLVGPGRTFFVGFDSTYRWRYLDEQFFDGFWARLIDRAGRNKQFGGRYPVAVTSDREHYRPGSQVTLTARFLDPNDAAASVESLQGEVDEGGGDPAPLTLLPKPGEAGGFEAVFTVRKAAPHTVRVWSGQITPAPPGTGTAAPRAATLQFPVDLPNIEYDQPGQDRATLEAIARATGGAVFDLDQIDQLPGAFKVHKVAHLLEDRQQIWHAPLLWGGVLLLLFTEWLLRKRYRMV